VLKVGAPDQIAATRRGKSMSESVYHPTTPQIAKRRKQLAPNVHEAFEHFSRTAFADGALPEKTKQLIAVAVAHVTQCPYCIQGHTKLARRKGNSEEEIMEAIWVAAEMRAGGAYAHSTLALHAMAEVNDAQEASADD
jgi:AhpD family alkylhydroperoxidase